MNLANQIEFSLDDYPVTIKKQNNLFYLVCNNLSIVESSESLDEAYRKLNQTREKFTRQLKELGIEVALQTKDKDSSLANNRSSRMRKLIIMFVIVAMFLASAGMFISYSKKIVTITISKMLSAAEAKVVNSLNTKFGDISNAGVFLDKIASTLERVTPERKEQIQYSLRRIVRVAQPFASELKPLFNDEK